MAFSVHLKCLTAKLGSIFVVQTVAVIMLLLAKFVREMMINKHMPIASLMSYIFVMKVCKETIQHQ